MGFYLRKAFGLGPIRLNLSKSGLGVSGGVRGARLGLTSDGRPYVHAGRGGLYLRQYLGSSSAGRQESRGAARDGQPTVIYEETGVTYPSPHDLSSETRATTSLDRRTRAIATPSATLVLGGAIAVIAFLIPHKPTGLLLGVVAFSVLITGITLMWRAKRRNEAGDYLGAVLSEVLADSREVSPAVEKRVNAALSNRWVTPEDREYYSRRTFFAAVFGIVEDRTASDQEIRYLSKLEELLELPREFVDGARAEAYRDAHLEAVADAELTADEERTLELLRTALSIPSSWISSELATASRLSEIRRIRDGDVVEVSVEIPLQNAETCYFKSEARMLKERNLRAYQRNGQRYTVRGLSIDKEGMLYITNKRVLMIHTGTSSVRNDKILDIDIDLDRNLLLLTKEGTKSALVFSVPDAALAGAILSAVAKI